jgi:hypothetical protein
MATRKSPTAAEALREQVPFTFDGVEYVVDPTSEWEYEVLEAFEAGKISAVLKALLGEEQHNKFKAGKPRVADLNRFVEAIQKALGISGN